MSKKVEHSKLRVSPLLVQQKNGFISIPWMIGLIIMFKTIKTRDIFIHEYRKNRKVQVEKIYFRTQKA